MRICDLLTSVGALDDQILEGDNFELEIDGFLLETVVVGMREDGPIIAVDDIALPYIPLEEGHTSLKGHRAWQLAQQQQDRWYNSTSTVTQQVGEAEYQGRKVSLGKPMAGDVKKSKVYVKGPSGRVVKVNFGDKKMKIKKSIPARRKSFRARHNCSNPGPRHKARYWSCRAWE